MAGFSFFSFVTENRVMDAECCDICDPESSARLKYPVLQVERGPPRVAAVSGKPNSDMLACLLAWRNAVFPTVFGKASMFGASALISDHDLDRISRCAPLPSISQLRRYLAKWPRAESHSESMWNALKDGGFTEPNPPPQTNASTAPAQRLPKPQATRKSRAPPKPRSSNTSSLESHDGTPIASGSARRTPPLPTAPSGWFSRQWMPERNYEVRRDVTMDDFRRMFAKKKEENAQAEASKPTHSPPTPCEPTPKRRRIEHQASASTPTHKVHRDRLPIHPGTACTMGPPRVPTAQPYSHAVKSISPSGAFSSADNPPPTPSEPSYKRRRVNTTMSTPSSSYTIPLPPQTIAADNLPQQHATQADSHMQARPVGRLMVPSQHSSSTAYMGSLLPSLPSLTYPTNLRHFTSASSVLPTRQNGPTNLQHPVPIRASSQRYLIQLDFAGTRALRPFFQAPLRPPAPRPSSSNFVPTTNSALWPPVNDFCL
jgi:hypothetical protein